MRFLLVAVALLGMSWFAVEAGAQEEDSVATLRVNKTDLRIPMAEAGSAGLEGWLLVPDTPGRHPLLILSHGYSSRPAERSPVWMLPEAEWFVRRGWAVVIVLRRGFGRSGGTSMELHLNQYLATQENFVALQRGNAADLRAAWKAVSGFDFVDATETVAAGFFTGGSAAMWLAEDSPPGLKAVLNFSGGWRTIPDWMVKGKVHVRPDVIAPAYSALGKATQVPTLWLYPKDGGEFSMKTALVAREAFGAAGGSVEMFTSQDKSSDNSFPFHQNPEEWGPVVEAFLSRLGLPAHDLVFGAQEQPIQGR